jgi:hypothetical protein
MVAKLLLEQLGALRRRCSASWAWTTRAKKKGNSSRTERFGASEERPAQERRLRVEFWSGR